MITLFSNPTYSRWSPFSNSIKSYDYFFQNYNHRFMCRAIGGDAVSAGTGVTYPYSTWVYRTYRNLSFNGVIAAYPDFPNGATTITDTVPTMARGFYPVTWTHTSLTLQTRYVVDKTAYEAITVWSWVQADFTMTLSGVSWYANAQNVTPTYTLKKVDKSGTITQLKTFTWTTQSLANVGTLTWSTNDSSAVSADINEGDIVYLELSIAIGSLYFWNTAYPTYRFWLNDLTLNFTIENV